MSQAERTRIAVVTGASSGIGKATAKALATSGWQVIGLGRDASRCLAAEAELRAAAPQARIHMIQADLSLLSEAALAARKIAALTDRIDVLVNNAGGVSNHLRMTPEGNEATFASNHLGPFVLTLELLPLLRRAAASAAAGSVRILATSSSGHRHCPGMDWDDLQRTRHFSSGGAYTSAKLANVLFTRSLAARLAADGIVAHAMEPGVVLDSNFVSHAEDGMQRYMATLQTEAVSSDEAARTIVWMATAAEPGHSSGGYYYECKPLEISAAAQDDDAAERLWMESLALASKAGLDLKL